MRELIKQKVENRVKELIIYNEKVGKHENIMPILIGQRPQKATLTK